jgi:DNA-directed RNA polymerase subunit RPC12/RpoP
MAEKRKISIFTAMSLVFAGVGCVLTMYVSDWNLVAGVCAAVLVYITAYMARRLVQGSSGEKDLEWRRRECPNCGMKVSIESKFCTYCGGRIEIKDPMNKPPEA